MIQNDRGIPRLAYCSMVAVVVAFGGCQPTSSRAPLYLSVSGIPHVSAHLFGSKLAIVLRNDQEDPLTLPTQQIEFMLSCNAAQRVFRGPELLEESSITIEPGEQYSFPLIQCDPSWGQPREIAFDIVSQLERVGTRVQIITNGPE